MKLLRTWVDWFVWIIVIIFFAFMITISVGCSTPNKHASEYFKGWLISYEDLDERKKDFYIEE